MKKNKPTYYKYILIFGVMLAISIVGYHGDNSSYLVGKRIYYNGESMRVIGCKTIDQQTVCTYILEDSSEIKINPIKIY